MQKKRRRITSPLERRRWLEELEAGRGITDIARRAKRDIRIVKRGIELSREEREVRQVHRDFLRDRLEQHQQALLKEVERLRALVAEGEVLFLEPGDSLGQKIHRGLREHVGRTTLGQMLTRYWKMVEAYQEVRGETERELQATFASLSFSLPPGATLDVWPRVALWKLDDAVAGKQPWTRRYEKTPQDGGHHFDWMGSRLTAKPLDEQTLSTAAEVHERLMGVAERWLPRMQERRAELMALGAQLADELEVFLVKGFVSGRCTFCPM